MSPLIIITHSSTFHADEVFGCALIRYFYPISESVLIVRTLDVEKTLAQYHPREQKGQRYNIVVLDIGKKLTDFSNITYLDHHQDKDIPCAAVLAKKWLISILDKDMKELIERTCSGWLPGVDAHDRGLADIEEGTQTLSQIITTFLPDDMNDIEISFEAALEFASAHISRCVKVARTQIKEESIILDKINNAIKNYIVFDKYLRETSSILSKRDDDNILYYIYPHNRGGWSIQTVNKKGCMAPRKPIPQDIPGANFVHASGFLACFPTKEQAIESVEKL